MSCLFGRSFASGKDYNTMQGDFEVAQYVGAALPQWWYPNAKSGLITTGDFVVLSTYSGCGDGTNEVVRSVLLADVTASLTDGSAHVCGILGIAAFSASTDSTGAANKQIVYSGKAATAEPISSVPSHGLTYPPFTWTTASVAYSYSPMRVIWATDAVQFWGKVYSGQTMSQAYVGGQAGLVVASGTDRTAHNACTIDLTNVVAGSLGDVVLVTGLDPLDTTRVKFQILPAFQQYRIPSGGYGRYTAQ